MKALFCVLFLFCLTLCSCIYEKLHEPIGYIKNNTRQDLVGANWFEEMADTSLCNDRIYINTYVQPGLIKELSTRPINLERQPDSVKEYIYIFNSDTLEKYRKLKICEGIVKRCLVKKIVIQLNKVKEPLDTIFINSSKPLN